MLAAAVVLIYPLGYRVRLLTGEASVFSLLPSTPRKDRYDASGYGDHDNLDHLNTKRSDDTLSFLHSIGQRKVNPARHALVDETIFRGGCTRAPVGWRGPFKQLAEISPAVDYVTNPWLALSGLSPLRRSLCRKPLALDGHTLAERPISFSFGSHDCLHSERIKPAELNCVAHGCASGSYCRYRLNRGRAFMLQKWALTFIAAMLVAMPALAIETQLPTAPSAQTAGNLLRPPAKVPSTTGAKAKVATVAKMTKKAKHAHHRNSDHAMPAKSTPADTTGSIPPKSVLPALY